MTRRKFLNLASAVLGSTAIVSFAYPFIRSLLPPTWQTKLKKMTVKKEDVPAGKTKEIIVNNTPVIIINRSEKGYIALSRVCTHLGCLVEYDNANKRLVCPCHAGIYDLEGNVVSGLPPKPLTEFPLKLEGENIVVG
jgi:cytochrome b6-f complex iron-sulfur subunit